MGVKYKSMHIKRVARLMNADTRILVQCFFAAIVNQFRFWRAWRRKPPSTANATYSICNVVKRKTTQNCDPLPHSRHRRVTNFCLLHVFHDAVTSAMFGEPFLWHVKQWTEKAIVAPVKAWSGAPPALGTSLQWKIIWQDFKKGLFAVLDKNSRWRWKRC